MQTCQQHAACEQCCKGFHEICPECRKPFVLADLKVNTTLLKAVLVITELQQERKRNKEKHQVRQAQLEQLALNQVKNQLREEELEKQIRLEQEKERLLQEQLRQQSLSSREKPEKQEKVEVSAPRQPQQDQQGKVDGKKHVSPGATRSAAASVVEANAVMEEKIAVGNETNVDNEDARQDAKINKRNQVSSITTERNSSTEMVVVLLFCWGFVSLHFCLFVLFAQPCPNPSQKPEGCQGKFTMKRGCVACDKKMLRREKKAANHTPEKPRKKQAQTAPTSEQLQAKKLYAELAAVKKEIQCLSQHLEEKNGSSKKQNKGRKKDNKKQQSQGENSSGAHENEASLESSSSRAPKRRHRSSDCASEEEQNLLSPKKQKVKSLSGSSSSATSPQGKNPSKERSEETETS